MRKHRVWAGVGTGLISLLLSGCWWQVGYDTGHTRHNTLEDTLIVANVATLTEAWSVSLPSPPSEPIVGNGRVYVALGDGDLPSTDVEVRSFDVATGMALWSTSLVSLPQEADFFSLTPVTFARDQLWTGWFTYNMQGAQSWSSAVRLVPETGAVLGADDDGGIPAPALDTGGLVVELVLVPSGPVQFKLQVRDEATLAVLWEAFAPVTVGFTMPIAVDGQIFVVIGSVLHAFALGGCGSPQCAPTWTVPVTNPNTDLLAAPGTDDLFAVGGSDVVAIDRATGAVRWRGPLGAVEAGAAIADDTVYVGTGTSLLAFPASGCGLAVCPPTWSGTLGSATRGHPVVSGGVVYIGSVDAVTAFAAEGCGGAATCPAIGGVAVGAPVSSMSVTEGRLFVANGTTLMAFAPAPAP